MTKPPTSSETLHELLGSVERGLDRHLAASSEWFPHEYVPYEVGRNYQDDPWQPRDSDLPDIARTSLEVNLLTEDNLPYYHLSLWRTFGDDDAWGEWVRRWTAEEGRHSIVIRDFLTVTRGIDPAELERGRMDMATRGWYPTFAEQGPLDGVAFTTIQELATRIAHRNTGVITEDERARALCARIATDENLHYVFYRDLGRDILEIDPSAMMVAIHRQVLGFKMPGAGISGFHDKAKEMGRAGVYNLRIHRDQVLDPVLRTHWAIESIRGLSDKAERARDEILNHLDRLDRAASRLGETPGPVRSDASSDAVAPPP
jgi:acyl-[acyl-carrier-protein] desaturase